MTKSKKKRKSLVGYILFGVKQVKYFNDEFQPACLYKFLRACPTGNFAHSLKSYKVRITIQEI